MEHLAQFWLMFLAVGWIVFLVGAAIVRRRREKPADFAAGVALSLTGDPDSWAYQKDEKWLQNHKASLAICLQAGFFGQVDTLQSSNQGSDKIIQFEGADLRAFRKAYDRWREATAMERQMVAEKRKRDALNAMKMAA